MEYGNVFFDDRLTHSAKLVELCEKLDAYSQVSGDSAYVLQSALGDEDEYDYDNGVLVLVPKHCIAIIDLNNDLDSNEFINYYNDVIDDIGYQSNKFEYKKILGRPREWRKFIVSETINNTLDSFDGTLDQWAVQRKDERRIELLISLLIGSINDPLRVGAEVPESDLMKVKKNIILYDCTQSRFVYESSSKDVVTIQGLAGTGKTELLLHKLQKLYVKDENVRIAFTCFNKVLANDMEKRVTQFFNFMHVDRQIEWDKRLWVFRSWGSGNDRNSGLYSYICSYYDIPFIRYSEDHNFSSVCKKAIEHISKRSSVEPCFDYLLIDESQDFSETFFILCRMVTKIQVIKAGDIFQNIFDFSFDGNIDCDYLLNKCYRTDPKTLMFAHAIGMGLYEKPIVRWLEDHEWEACGYKLDRNGQMVSLSRSPIRRFQDISSDAKSVVLVKSNTNAIVDNVISIISKIQENYPEVIPDDIGIVFTTRNNSVFETMDLLANEIKKKYGFDVTLGHMTKIRETGKVFLSNINNVKGLEFPFVICIQQNPITRSVYQRNAIYMALTRSFLSSFFIVSSERNESFISEYQYAADQIEINGKICVPQPSEAEIKQQVEQIRIQTQNAKRSLDDIIDEVCSESQYCNLIDYDIRKRVGDSVASMIGGKSDIDEEKIKSITNNMLGMAFGIEI